MTKTKKFRTNSICTLMHKNEEHLRLDFFRMVYLFRKIIYLYNLRAVTQFNWLT